MLRLLIQRGQDGSLLVGAVVANDAEAAVASAALAAERPPR